jgi:hypothetical protein
MMWCLINQEKGLHYFGAWGLPFTSI